MTFIFLQANSTSSPMWFGDGSHAISWYDLRQGCWIIIWWKRQDQSYPRKLSVVLPTWRYDQLMVLTLKWMQLFQICIPLALEFRTIPYRCRSMYSEFFDLDRFLENAVALNTWQVALSFLRTKIRWRSTLFLPRERPTNWERAMSATDR